jgi:hypothetical protein
LAQPLYLIFFCSSLADELEDKNQRKEQEIETNKEQELLLAAENKKNKHKKH